MASQEIEEESKIPLLTVIKNDAVLKNIFLLNSPPSKSNSLHQETQQPEEDEEEILVVGRHPDCNIVLTHPSISRFHLQIVSKPSSQTLSVIDLSSVHGTWVCDKKIEAGIKVDLKEGDILRMGASSRVYKLHWVNFSQAYDLEKPFWLQDDLSKKEDAPKNADGNGSSEKENLESEVKQCDQNLESLVKGEQLSLSSVATRKIVPEVSGGEQIDRQSPLRQFLENKESIWYESNVTEMIDATSPDGDIPLELQDQHDGEKEDQVQVVVVVDVNAAHTEITEIHPCQTKRQYSCEESDSSLGFKVVKDGRQAELLSQDEIENFDGSENYRVTNLLVPKICRKGEIPENPAAEARKTEEVFGDQEDLGILGTSKADTEQCDEQGLQRSRSLTREEPLGKEQGEVSPPILPDKQSDLPNIWSRRGKSECALKVQTSVKEKTRGTCFDIENEARKQRSADNKKEPRNLCTGLESGEDLFTPDAKNAQLITSLKKKDGLVEINQLEIQGRSFSKILFPGFEREENEKFTPDKENFTPTTRFLRSMKKKGELDEIKQEGIENNSGILSTGYDRDEDEIFTPDKENCSPHTRYLNSMRKGGNPDQIKLSASCRSPLSKFSYSPHLPLRDIVVSSGKENRAMNYQEQRSAGPNLIKGGLAGPGRVPFGSLCMNSGSKSKSEASVNNGRSYSVKQLQSNPLPKGTTRWHMVVDSSCLLNKESRKALQLLQGVKGTQLIVPKIVIRELDCLKRRGSLFRSTTEAAKVLDWIEDCMVKTKWWIHVQNSAEEGRLTAPTPPASPQSQLGEDSFGFPGGLTSSMPFSLWGSVMDIVSPTAEDHILDCGLLFKEMQKDGQQLVLLTNDVSLKIKAMAEGLICETAEQFRESLVNPFSERFLWADSSPRGQTWNCLDDVVLREMYKAGESVKGLKLILLHNFQYRQSRFVS